jgi:hypothetical protein
MIVDPRRSLALALSLTAVALITAATLGALTAQAIYDRVHPQGASHA